MTGGSTRLVCIISVTPRCQWQKRAPEIGIDCQHLWGCRHWASVILLWLTVSIDARQ